MTSPPTQSIKVFYSYAHEDEKLRDELKKHLANLKRQGIITEWYDRDILAGKEWDEEIKSQLDSARVILLLISPDFMNSDYSNAVEVRRAMERHEAREARVIPIILRPVDWEGAPFSKLQGLPTDAKAVTLWQNPDQAFVSVVNGIRTALKDLTLGSGGGHSLTNIPRPPVVGFVARRDSEGRDIVERLQDELAPQKNQLVVLSGPGGVGKTTLAGETARALTTIFAQRIVWTSALGRADFSLSTLLDEIATQLEHADLRHLAIESKVPEVQALIASAATLIILDNFETVRSAEQTSCVEFLLNRAPCPVLITTRQRIESARNIAIPAMSPAEAHDFLQRLIHEASDPAAFAHLDRERIMMASDRNPLVMQWVTAQIDLAQEADTALNELAQGVGDAAQRVFDRSFELEQLGDDGRAALLALSLFAPDASRHALGDVAGLGEDTARLNEAIKLLAGLWLTKTAAAGSRLVVEGLTRELTRSRMIKDKLGDEFRQRFVAHFLRYAQAHAQPVPNDYDALEAERDNLLSAMELALTQKDWNSLMTIRLALEEFLDIHGYWEDAITTGKSALRAAAETKADQALGVFSHNLAVIYQRRGDYQEAQRLYDESLQIKKQRGDQRGIASTLHELGRLAQAQGDLGEARRLYDESLYINKQLANQSGIAITLHQLATLAQAQGDLGEARRLYDESLQIKKQLGNQNGIAVTLHQLATLAHAQGDLGEARRLYDESLQIEKQLGNQNGIAITLHQLAMLAQDQGDRGEARRLYDESLQIKKQLGDQSGIATTLHQLAILAQDQGDPREARRLCDESLRIKRQLGDQQGIAITLHQLGILAADEGNNGDASRLFSEALAIFVYLKSPYAEVARENLERVEGSS